MAIVFEDAYLPTIKNKDPQDGENIHRSHIVIVPDNTTDISSTDFVLSTADLNSPCLGWKGDKFVQENVANLSKKKTCETFDEEEDESYLDSMARYTPNERPLHSNPLINPPPHRKPLISHTPFRKPFINHSSSKQPLISHASPSVYTQHLNTWDNSVNNVTPLNNSQTSSRASSRQNGRYNSRPKFQSFPAENYSRFPHVNNGGTSSYSQEPNFSNNIGSRTVNGYGRNIFNSVNHRYNKSHQDVQNNNSNFTTERRSYNRQWNSWDRGYKNSLEKNNFYSGRNFRSRGQRRPFDSKARRPR